MVPNAGASPSTTEFRAALRFPWLSRYYDAILGWTLNDRRFKQILAESADIRPAARILDFGCGTGTLAQEIHSLEPTARIVGLDVDPRMIEQAERKSRIAGQWAQWITGRIEALPFPPGSFDRIVTSLVLHHLRTNEKRSSLRAAHALLRPGGEIHIMDFGKAHGPVMRLAFLSVQILDGFDRTGDNARGMIPAMLREAGFVGVREVRKWRTVAGTLSLYTGSKEVENAP